MSNRGALIIVESPFKAKTIKKIVGDNYEVMSSQGHICDLPQKDLGIDINNDFKPNYVIDRLKKKIVNDLKLKSKSAGIIYLASDDDREGEAISWHLKNVLELDDSRIKRIVFHEVTEKAIKNAISNPRAINLDLVNSQQARRILDRLVGYKVSPILWQKIKTGLSAGRVQSVAVRLIVEREKEILDFKPTVYYKVNSIFEFDNKIFKSELKNDLGTKDEVIELFKNIKNSEFIVDEIEKKTTVREPIAPFTTSSLQQDAANKLGFSVQMTMQIAQRLYESGKITYMRTDSVVLSEDAIKQAHDVILKEFGEEYIQNRQFKIKTKLVQGAHEAIRPTNLSVVNVSNDQYEQKLYCLIRNRCLASQMTSARINKTVVKIRNTNLSKEEFITRGEVIEFDGFLKLYHLQDEDDKDSSILPDLKKNDILKFVSITGKEKTTRPKARFTEATLVKELEEKGIGRPSTYAPIISIIQNRGYVIKSSKAGVKKEISVINMIDNEITESAEVKTENSEQNKLYPTDIAVGVNEFLVKNFSDITDYDFTANVENQLDNISEGKLDWIKFLHKFYDGLLIELCKCSDVRKVEFTARLLGVDPKTNKNMYLKLTKYGPVLQLGDNNDSEKPKYFNLLKNQNINDFTFQDGLNLMSLPKIVGKYNGNDIFICNGKFGPYVKCGDLNATIFDLSRVFEIGEEEAIGIIINRQKYKKKNP